LQQQKTRIQRQFKPSPFSWIFEARTEAFTYEWLSIMPGTVCLSSNLLNKMGQNLLDIQYKPSVLDICIFFFSPCLVQMTRSRKIVWISILKKLTYAVKKSALKTFIILQTPSFTVFLSSYLCILIMKKLTSAVKKVPWKKIIFLPRPSFTVSLSSYFRILVYFDVLPLCWNILPCQPSPTKLFVSLYIVISTSFVI